MTKPEILRALGWNEKLIAAFEMGKAEAIDVDEIELDLEPLQTTTTEVSLRIESPILLTSHIASAR
jgi:hypothetical protein